MVPIVVLLLAALLGVTILVVEIGRGRLRGHLDFLRFTSVVFFVCFVILPPYLQFADLSSLRASPWFWVFHRSFNDDGFAYAQAMALIGYGCIVLGFLTARAFQRYTVGESIRPVELDDGTLAIVGHVVGFGGLAALVVYTYAIGGLIPLVLQADAFRSGTPPVVTPFAFLKTLTPLVIAAAFVFHGLGDQASTRRRQRRARIWFWFYFFTSLLVLFHQAGRFPLAAFLITFPVAAMVRTDRFKLGAVVGATAVVFLMLLFGKQAFQAALDNDAVSLRLDELVGGTAAVLRQVLIEFCFPVVTLANAAGLVPVEVSFRWLQDFPLALEYVIPQRLLGIQHPPTVSMINTELLHATGTVPVDLLSVGYFSAGVPGLILLTVLFGALLALFERWLPSTASPVGGILRVAWMFFIGLRVMYGDPQLIWFSGLHLLALAVVLAWAGIVARGSVAQPKDGWEGDGAADSRPRSAGPSR